MHDELPCVWNALFAESDEFSFGYNEKLLNSSVADVFSKAPLGPDMFGPKASEALYSLKRALKLILDSEDNDMKNEALEALFKVREELITTFEEVSKEQGLEELLTQSVKLIIMDAFNRKTRERNQEFSPLMPEVSNVKRLEDYLKVTTEILSFIKGINSLNRKISDTNKKIEETKARRKAIDTNLLRLAELDPDE